MAKLENYSSYEIYEDGRIYSYKSRKWLTLKPRRDGYIRVRLVNDNGEIKDLYLHRIIAQTFIPNPDNLPQVNHKDENKGNSCVDNLEWCNAKYNANYGTRNERIIKSQEKKVYCVELNKVFDSIKAAQEELRIKGHHIGEVCNGKRKSCDGYHWEWYCNAN